MNVHDVIVLHEPIDDFGYVGSIVTTPGLVFAVGGAHGAAALGSTTGAFFPVRVRPDQGLRACAVHGDDLWIVGTHGLLAKSDDLGVTWQEHHTDTGGCLFGLVVEDDAIWVCGDGGLLQRTTDGGATWTAYDAGDRRLYGLAALGDGIHAFGYDVWRIDGDAPVSLGLAARGPITALIATRAGTLVAVGDGGQVWRRPAGGDWEHVDAGVGGRDIEDAIPWGDGVLLVGAGGQIRISDDDARAFEKVDSGTTATLWGAAVVAGGALITGEDGLILHVVSDPDAQPFAPGEDRFDRPGPLDDLVDRLDPATLPEALPSVLGAIRERLYGPAEAPSPVSDDVKAAVRERIAAIVSDDALAPHERAYRFLAQAGDLDDFEHVLGIAPHADLRDLLTALRGAPDVFYEWDPAVDIWPSPPEDLNLFEQLVLREQQAYLGTGLIEAVGGLVCLGSLGNGDTYHMDTFPVDGDRPAVYVFNHETHGLEAPIAAHVGALAALSVLAGVRDELSEGAYERGIRKLDGLAAPTWHFSRHWPDDLETYEPHSQTARYLAFRANWITYFLRADGVHDIEELGEFFIASMNPPLTDEQHAAWLQGAPQLAQTALYLMWRCYLFDDPHLEAYLEIGRSHKARLARDAAKLIDELRAGRNTLGKIADVQDALRRFRALDLDPSRAEARAREAEAAKEAERLREAAAQAEVAEVFAAKGLEGLTRLAWQRLDDQAIHDAIALTLWTVPELGAVTRHTRFVEERGWSRENLSLDFEAFEAIHVVAAEAPGVYEALWTGALLRPRPERDESGAVLCPPPPSWHFAARYLEALSACRPLDPRVGPALDPVLDEHHKYEHRRERAVRVMVAAGHVSVAPRLLEILRSIPLDGDMLASIRNEDLNRILIEALATFRYRPALDELTRIALNEDHSYRKVRAEALRALAVIDPVAAQPTLIAGLSLPLESGKLALAEALGGAYERLLTEGDFDDAEALADAAAVWEIGRGNVDQMAQGLLRRAVGRGGGDIEGLIRSALARPAYSRDDVEAGTILAIRASGAVPAIDVETLRYYAFVEDRATRDAAREALAERGEEVDDPVVFLLPDADALSDEALLAALSSPTTVGVGALAIAAKQRKLSDAVGPLVEALARVFRFARPSLANQPTYVSYPIRWIGQALAKLGLNEAAVALYNEVLSGPSRELKGPLLRQLPSDPRLVPGVEAVAAEGWGWQGSTAERWLAEPHPRPLS